jgi:uncharacterized protein
MLVETPEMVMTTPKTKPLATPSKPSFPNSLIQMLVPKDKRFFPLFDEFGEIIGQASNSYSELLHSKDPAQSIAFSNNVGVLETRGDELTHAIVTNLTATFLTPFDREDMHRLATALDGIMDELEAGARRIALYNVHLIPPHLQQMGKAVETCGNLAREAMLSLKDIRNPKEFASKIRVMQQTKSTASELFLQGMASLYNGDYEGNLVLKLREIFYATDNALRYFQELSFALEAVLIKTT